MLPKEELNTLIAKRGILKGLNSTLGITAIVMTVVFILYAVLLGKTASEQFIGIKTWIENTLGWYYILVMFMAFVVCVYLMCSRVGKIRLGRDTDRPEFSNFAWFSMLFGCGTGAGMLFFSMSEPMIHFASQWSGGNPFLSSEVKAAVADFFAAKQAALDKGLMPGDAGFPVPNDLVADAAAGGIKLTVFHWGTIAWSMYAVVGLSLAYFAFRKGLPLSIRSALYPLIGQRIYGPIGHTVDILAVFGTIFGIATTLGLGVNQIGAGLVSLGVLEKATQTVTVVSILLITVIATLSATSGVARGIKRLSTLNTWICLVILAYFMLVTDTNYLVASSITALGDYLTEGISMTLWTARSGEERTWQGGWTIFYWGWWMAWSAFVGMFIARISRGRTIREFVLGVMLIPSVVALVWFGVIGSAGIHQSLYGADMTIYNAAINDWDYAGTLYNSFDVLTPGTLAVLAKMAALVVVVIFFVTSADSGTLVLGRLLAFGQRPPVQQRILWGMALGAVTLIILLLGGDLALKSLQAASIAGALPFTFVLLAMMYGLVKSLREDSEQFIDNEEHIRRLIEQEVSDLS
ncbi:BCCT family transporter [Marinobacterium weihaiense]|uniref:BCCT family transporter n=1 Tax=Marinobacterium weihaiense TaxID=2851016 RepID=A0ABS6M9L3_9GAMM|nr:BCCT family transporter [Marinobacterium weihaiense]MBV0932973.1 BCCT family transporter [Marinobacterium weihaiense]